MNWELILQIALGIYVTVFVLLSILKLITDFRELGWPYVIGWPILVLVIIGYNTYRGIKKV